MIRSDIPVDLFTLQLDELKLLQDENGDQLSQPVQTQINQVSSLCKAL